MRPEDVGLSTDTLLKVKGPSKGTPRITYAVVYKCDNFSVRFGNYSPALGICL